MTAVTKNLFIDKLDKIVDKYINTYRKTIHMKLADIKASILKNRAGIEHKVKDVKFKDGNHERISNYKKYFAKGYTPNSSE